MEFVELYQRKVHQVQDSKAFVVGIFIQRRIKEHKEIQIRSIQKTAFQKGVNSYFSKNLLNILFSVKGFFERRNHETDKFEKRQKSYTHEKEGRDYEDGKKYQESD